MTTAVKLTLEEFLARPETKPASEYACGEVTRKSMPTRLHGLVQALIGALLFRWMEQTGRCGEAGMEICCLLGPSGRRRAYVPDVTYVSSERLPAADALYYDVPDLAVEVLSPGDRPRRWCRGRTPPPIAAPR